ncbi:hypothetical protein ACFQ0T_02890 [Kitasatospora gansuensis]
MLSLAYLARLARPNTDPLHTGGIALAVLPWTLTVVPPLYRSIPTDAHDLLRNAGVTFVLLATATTIGTLRRNSRMDAPRRTGRTASLRSDGLTRRHGALPSPAGTSRGRPSHLRGPPERCPPGRDLL